MRNRLWRSVMAAAVGLLLVAPAASAAVLYNGPWDANYINDGDQVGTIYGGGGIVNGRDINTAYHASVLEEANVVHYFQLNLVGETQLDGANGSGPNYYVYIDLTPDSNAATYDYRLELNNIPTGVWPNRLPNWTKGITGAGLDVANLVTSPANGVTGNYWQLEWKYLGEIGTAPFEWWAETRGGYPSGNSIEDTTVQVLSSAPPAPPVPIPGAAWLLGSGLVGLIGLRRRAVKKAQ